MSGFEADVVRVDFGACALLLDDGRTVEAGARGKLMGPKKSLGNAVVVGDRAHCAVERDRAVVEAVAPRRNVFSRRAAGSRVEEQVVAANLDQVVVVASIVEPEFKAGLVDRVLAQAEHLGLPARLALTKLDLASHDAATALLDDYRRAGFAAHVVSARTGEGVEAVRHACLGRRSLFVGHSGVGKSRLLNALVPGLEMLIGGVNAKTGKGRHTTTAAWLVRPEAGFDLIDTPGVRAFGLWGVSSRDLEQSYPEFRRHLGACRYADCGHLEEPECALRAAVASGEVPRRRFESFLKLRDELAREEQGELERVRATTRYGKRRAT
jgi:ribosome biogenesis GTPase / thiamine phosphate phosphatase